MPLHEICGPDRHGEGPMASCGSPAPNASPARPGAFSALALATLSCWLTVSGCASSQRLLRTENIVLITVDGLRPTELFGGMDPTMLADPKRSGIESVESVRALYHRDSPGTRREALLPFFWGELARRGVVLGNRQRGSPALLRNPLRFSYPGYAELLVGEPQESVTSNDRVRIGTPTILEFVAAKLGLGREDVAVFASWDVFSFIACHEEGRLFSNCGYEMMPEHMCDPEMLLVNRLQAEVSTPWDTVRHDAVTARLGLGYLRRYRPRFLYLAFGETDDWAHERRYDRVLAAARLFDDTLRELWRTLESIPQYRGRTTLVITTDHGRGRTLDDWTDHGKDVAGAEDIWVAIIGPDTPDIGEVENAPVVYLGDVAATILRLLELDVEEFNPRAGPAIPIATASPSRSGADPAAPSGPR